MPTILFLSALQEELDPLWLDSRFDWSEPSLAANSIWCRTCEYSGYRLVSAAACEMGLVASANLTASLILQWRPLVVIALGICAGRPMNLHLGDCVISSSAFLYRFGRHVDGRFSPQERRTSVSEEIARVTERVVARWPRELPVTFSTRPTAPKVVRGAYACADFVLKDERVMEETALLNSELQAVDMESYAVLRTAELLRVPFGAVVTKAVSDHGDEFKSDEGRSFVKSVSKEVAVLLAMEFMDYRRTESLPRNTAVTSDSQHRSANFDRLLDRILIVCPQSLTFRMMIEKVPGRSCRLESTSSEVPSVHVSEDGTMVIAPLPDGHYGHVDAAIWSCVFVALTSPNLVILVGSCGGLSRETRLGDLIIASRSIHFQFGAFKGGQLYPEVRSIPIHDGLRGFLFACFRPSLDKLVASVFEKYSSTGTENGLRQYPSWHIDPLASSDLYLCDEEKVSEAVAQDRKVIGVEMEGYAVMRICQQAAVPLGCLVIRAVADYADRPSSHHLEFAERLSVEAASQLLESGVRNLQSHYVRQG